MDMHCFSFVMMYGLSSDNILYSTRNQFLYVNKTLLHFLNIKQEFSFMNWFLCLCHVSLGQHWGKWNKKMSKTSNIPYVQAIYVVVYRRGGLKLLYTILWTIVLWTRFHMYSTSFFFFLSATSMYCRWLLDHYLVNSLTHLMLITGHWQCCVKFGFRSQV